MKIFPASLKSLSDEELMIKVKENNESAFEEIYNRYNRKLLHFLYKMLGNSEMQAQDFLHDIFLKIIEKPYLFDQSKKFKTWIFQIALNKCKNEYRKNEIRKQAKTNFELNDMYIAKDNKVESEIDLKLLKNKINQELLNFEEKHYSTFILRFQHEMSLKEIAEISDCPEGTVKSRLFYVTQRLVEKLKEYN